MKARKGFVSNSSTSSFILIGISLDEDEYKEKFKVEDTWDLEEKLADGLTTGTGEENDYVAIGIDPCVMKDDQTLGDFKGIILELLHKSGLTDVKIEDLGWHEDSYYNG